MVVETIASLAIIQNIGSTLTSAVTLANFGLSLKNTPKDVKTCLSLINRIDADIHHAESLRTKTLPLLLRAPDELKTINDLLKDCYQGLQDIGRLVEECRVEAAGGGSVSLKAKMKWVLGDSASFVLRSRSLQAHQAALWGQITYMRMLSPTVGTAISQARDLEESVDDWDFEIPVSPWQSQSKLNIIQKERQVFELSDGVQKSMRHIPSAETLVNSDQDASDLALNRNSAYTGRIAQGLTIYVSNEKGEITSMDDEEEDEADFFRHLKMREEEQRRERDGRTAL